MISAAVLGAFLSGGVDSPTIVALMQRVSNRPVRTFTISFDDPAYDESPDAEAVARHLGTDHQTVEVTAAEAQGVIPSLSDLYDEPVGDSSQIPTHLVCRAARTQVTVARSGNARDELFGGYNRYVLGPGLWRRIGWMPAGVRTCEPRSANAGANSDFSPDAGPSARASPPHAPNPGKDPGQGGRQSSSSPRHLWRRGQAWAVWRSRASMP